MKKIFWILIAIIYVILLFYIFSPERIQTDSGKIDLFFCQKTNCSSIIVQLIQQAQNIKCVFYDLDEPNVLIALNQPKVETLIFKENYEGLFTPVTSKGLMHDKFCVFDEKIVLTGSWNPTMRGTYYNDNNVILIYSKKISEAYLKEFERIKTGKSHKGNYQINLSGTYVQLCFSPIGNCEEKIISTLSEAKQEILFLTFTFTSEKIGEILISKFKENVEVTGVFEKSKISQYSVYSDLKNLGMKVYLDENKYNMHHKLFLIDGEVLIIGSYNPTKSANTVNDENTLIIQNKNMAYKIQEEFSRIKSLI